MLDTATCRLRIPERERGVRPERLDQQLPVQVTAVVHRQQHQQAARPRPQLAPADLDARDRSQNPPRQRSSIPGCRRSRRAAEPVASRRPLCCCASVGPGQRDTPAPAGPIDLRPARGPELGRSARRPGVRAAAASGRRHRARPSGDRDTDRRRPAATSGRCPVASASAGRAAASTRPSTAPTSSCTTVCRPRASRASHGQPSISALKVIVSIWPARLILAGPRSPAPGSAASRRQRLPATAPWARAVHATAS